LASPSPDFSTRKHMWQSPSTTPSPGPMRRERPPEVRQKTALAGDDDLPLFRAMLDEATSLARRRRPLAHEYANCPSTLGAGATGARLEIPWPPHHVDPGARAKTGGHEPGASPGLCVARHTGEGAARRRAPPGVHGCPASGVLVLKNIHRRRDADPKSPTTPSSTSA
jgi:hypothetical protein